MASSILMKERRLRNAGVPLPEAGAGGSRKAGIVKVGRGTLLQNVLGCVTYTYMRDETGRDRRGRVVAPSEIPRPADTHREKERGGGGERERRRRVCGD